MAPYAPFHTCRCRSGRAGNCFADDKSVSDCKDFLMSAGDANVRQEREMEGRRHGERREVVCVSALVCVCVCVFSVRNGLTEQISGKRA